MYGGDLEGGGSPAATPSRGVSARGGAWHTRLPTTLNPRRPGRRRLNYEAGIKPETVEYVLIQGGLTPLEALERGPTWEQIWEQYAAKLA